MDPNVINNADKLSALIDDRGILIIIAALFLMGVIILGGIAVMLMKKILSDSSDREGKAEVRTEKLALALQASTEATKANTTMYANTKEMHEKMDSDIVEIKREMAGVRINIDIIKGKFEKSEADRAEMIKKMNELSDQYDKLAITLTDKLEILITKAS